MDMRNFTVLAVGALLLGTSGAYAASAEAGRQLVMRSCSTCHTTGTATNASDAAPPLSVLAKDNKERPAWIRGWLMAPHPPMPSIPLSRQQIDDIIAYLRTLPAA
jgi:mono/diheme cytochrome c family protein